MVACPPPTARRSPPSLPPAATLSAAGPRGAYGVVRRGLSSISLVAGGVARLCAFTDRRRLVLCEARLRAPCASRSWRSESLVPVRRSLCVTNANSSLVLMEAAFPGLLFHVFVARVLFIGCRIFRTPPMFMLRLIRGGCTLPWVGHLPSGVPLWTQPRCAYLFFLGNVYFESSFFFSHIINHHPTQASL